MRRFSVLTAAVLVAFGSPAAATIVFSNGAPNSQGAWDLTSDIVADDFVLASGTNITSAGVYLGNRLVGVSPASNGTPIYFIFADASGMPGTLLASGNVVPTSVTDTGVSWSSVTPRDAYLVTFNLISPFAAAPGTTYWFGLQYTATTGFGVWAISNSQGNNQVSVGATMNNWQDGGDEMAFYLDGSPAGVPEPSTWAMMLLGFGGVGIALRGSRKRLLAA